MLCLLLGLQVPRDGKERERERAELFTQFDIMTQRKDMLREERIFLKENNQTCLKIVAALTKNFDLALA